MLIQEVVQQTTTASTTTVTTVDTSLVALVALILGIVATALGIPLAIFKIKDYYGRKPKAILKLLAPRFREIRRLLVKPHQTRSAEDKDIEAASRIYWDEIIRKGFYRPLRELSDRGVNLSVLFFEMALLSGLAPIDSSGTRARKTKRSMEKRREILCEITDQIDRILEKSEGA